MVRQVVGLEACANTARFVKIKAGREGEVKVSHVTHEINLTCQYPAIMGVVHYNMSYKLVTCTESAFCATRRFIMPTLVRYLDMGVLHV